MNDKEHPTDDNEPVPAEEAEAVTDDTAESASVEADGDASLKAPEQPDAAEPNTPPQTDQTAKKPGRAAGVLAFLALLLALIAVGGSVYLYLQMEKLRGDSTAASATQQNQLAEIDVRPRVDAIEQSVSELSSTDAQGQQINSARIDDLQAAVRVLQESGSRGDRAWTMAEVRYLLKMAVHRIVLAGDLDSAAAATQAADSQLHTLADVSLLPVREALAREIALLRGTPKPDIEGKVLTLIHLARRSNILPLQRDRSRPAAQASEVAAAETDETATDPDYGDQFMNFLTQFVVIKAAPATEDITPEEQAEASLGKRASLQVMLQRAQIAVLRRDQQDFSDAVTAAKLHLVEHFDQNNELVERFAEDLKALVQNPVRPQLEGIGEGLRLLDQIEAGQGVNQ